MQKATIFSLAAVLAFSSAANADGFRWSNDCDASGDFTRFIARSENTLIGEIPAGKLDLSIVLTSDQDVDVRLRTVSGTRIIWWAPTAADKGLLSGPSAACATHEGLEYCYSGYNGIAGERGHETITINGTTNTPLVMSAFGYQAGNAQVDYTYRSPSCNEKGSGSFSQYLGTAGESVLVGTIPANKHGVQVRLEGVNDLDINLTDASNDYLIIGWPDGKLNQAGYQTTEYEGMDIAWSGYNGDGTGFGHEFVTVGGRVSTDLQISAYAYQTGVANVTYSWGDGVGETCGGVAGTLCENGLTCKEMTGSIGVCHAPNWCLSDETAAADCSSLPIPMDTGWEWSCPAFECVGTATGGWPFGHP